MLRKGGLLKRILPYTPLFLSLSGNFWLCFTYPVIKNAACLIGLLMVVFGRICLLSEALGNCEMAEKLPVIIDNRSNNTVLRLLQKLLLNIQRDKYGV